ncbi:MAG: spondin domain-containing protein [Actinobacteria bacterium]|nr:spondin domain-containing protein [Actinomycetota bacterium]
MTQSRRLTPVVALVALAALLLTLLGAAPADAGSERTYRVTITNLTNGQPMTPFVVATHSGSTSIFEVGSAASPGLQALAENGAAGVLAAELGSNPRVGDVAVAGTAPFGSGESVWADIVSTPGARKLSVAGMLICTNDGFGAIDSVQLNNNGKTRTLFGFAYDAGTEINTEAYVDLVPPCDGLGQTGTTNPALAEGGVVHGHNGIQGGGDLTPGSHGWTGAVIEVTIEPLG